MADHQNRKQLYNDSKVQTALLARVVLYWCAYLIAVAAFILVWRIVTGPARVFYTHFEDMWFHFGPAVVVSFLLLPLVLWDMLKLSNRFVGPLTRLREHFRMGANGQEVPPIHFREGDFWHEVSEEFNAMVAEIQRRETADGDSREGDAIAKNASQAKPQLPQRDIPSHVDDAVTTV